MPRAKLAPARRDPLATFFRPQEPAGVEELAEAKLIDIDLLDPNPYQPRRQVDPTALEELAASIRQHGILQPLVVRKVGDRYQIVAGERRWRAAQRVQLRQVPCFERGVSDDDMELLALLENIQREDLDPVDQAHIFQHLINRFGLSLRDLAARVHKSHEYVAQRLRLLQDPEVTEAVRAGVLSPTVADKIAKLDDPDRRRELLQRAFRGERLRVKDVQPEPPSTGPSSAQPAQGSLDALPPRDEPQARPPMADAEQPTSSPADAARHPVDAEPLPLVPSADGLPASPPGRSPSPPPTAPPTAAADEASATLLRIAALRHDLMTLSLPPDHHARQRLAHELQALLVAVQGLLLELRQLEAPGRPPAGDADAPN